jgi:hypothetical protein
MMQRVRRCTSQSSWVQVRAGRRTRTSGAGWKRKDLEEGSPDEAAIRPPGTPGSPPTGEGKQRCEAAQILYRVPCIPTDQPIATCRRFANPFPCNDVDCWFRNFPSLKHPSVQTEVSNLRQPFNHQPTSNSPSPALDPKLDPQAHFPIRTSSRTEGMNCGSLRDRRNFFTRLEHVWVESHGLQQDP